MRNPEGGSGGDFAFWSWPALLVAPSVALLLESAAYASIKPACDAAGSGRLHALSAVALAVTVALTAMAALAWRRSLAQFPSAVPGVTAADAGDAERRRPFVAMAGTAVGAVSSGVVVALWLPVWFIQPCAFT